MSDDDDDYDDDLFSWNQGNGSIPSNSWTLKELKEWLEERLDKGTHCPLCKQKAQRYWRKLDQTMINALGLLYKAGGLDHYVHGQDTLRHHARPAKELGKLAYFGLAKEDTRRREDGGQSGWWMVTREGYLFLKGQHQVQKYAVVYAGVVLRHEDELIDVTQVAPEFRFDDLMDGK